jgi:AraC family transcriptional regulator
MALAGKQGLLGGAPRTFGVYYDDPAATPVDALRADACLAIPADAVPSGDLAVREIRGGRFAVVRHIGPYAELERPYKWLYGTWLARSGEEPDNAPIVEEYMNDAHMTPPSELVTEIWLPLR